MSRLRVVTTISLLLFGAACLDDSITGVRPLTVELQVAPTVVSVSETVVATWAATGSGLQGVILDWGDGQLDSIPLGGLVVEAEQQIGHAYAVSGSFTVTARAEDQTGARTATARVEVK